ncbi:HEAT repeat-containing protein [Thermodesulforhabdus norvegica]|uniref:HEAT repeat-containing protein n=2 Tax=Thermodesulforhabdus norvegica TaxID=39841 RepID=A0A1I4QLR7_9BACT|nr:HEAT repeat-containing protein [Thermodesulforhabdus norvegica]
MSVNASDRFAPVYAYLKGETAENVCLRYGIGRKELERRIGEYQHLARRAAAMESLPGEKISRNDPCPCGSGKKYKKCCMPLHEEIRKTLPRDRWLKQEEKARKKKFLEKEVQRGFDLLLSMDFGKAERLATKLLTEFPEDDRLHDILMTVFMVRQRYDDALVIARKRWQVALEERDYYQEHGQHKRDRDDTVVHFYSPSTWLEKFWIAQRAGSYSKEFPEGNHPVLKRLSAELMTANDVKRFPQRDQEGYRVRREALDSVIEQIKSYGEDAYPYVLPLAYYFSWASLFVPEVIAAPGTERSLRLLAELSMFRFPFFAQMCLKHLEEAGERSVPIIRQVIESHKAFDELKVGLILVLGNIVCDESFSILVELTEHENPYVVNWVAQALGKHQNPAALPYLEKARERLGELSKIAGAIRELVETR